MNRNIEQVFYKLRKSNMALFSLVIREMQL